MDTSKRNYQCIAAELQISIDQVQATARLLDEGGTIPFISRYRKEITGALDEVQVTGVRDQLVKRAELDKRRQAILESLDKRELLNDELASRLHAADEMGALEDIYLPYKQKRKTRATAARDKGLEPLARALYTGREPGRILADSVHPEKDVPSEDAALAGARDIMAEWISEDASIRKRLRTVYAKKSVIRSTVIEKNRESGSKFRDYFDWREDCRRASGHGLLALFRGEAEKVLRLSIRPDDDQVLVLLEKTFLPKPGHPAAVEQVRLAAADGYKRLLGPALEKELRTSLRERAEKEAIRVFSDNLRELLLASPLGRKRVLALDPGFRTGAKLVCLDEQGTLLCHDNIFPTHGGRKREEAAQRVKELCSIHNIQAIGIGNGTASRETEEFIRSIGLADSTIITQVNESGASIYSASEVARREFPNHDITVRGAVSIGRRLQDPLAELVKLDPRSIGVGQYQHDVAPARLTQALNDVVVSCVNNVGVELNSASVELLSHVSGLGPVLAANIVTYRNEHGSFSSRKELLKVPRLGEKAYELCGGFLRIQESNNPLDNSAVHPERYSTVETIARDLGCTVSDLIADKGLRERIDPHRYISPAIGLPTLTDILAELARPGRDPRQEFTSFAFAEGIHTITDLEEGMRLPGIVTNVTTFGAFIDIGVHQDGLAHISQLADRYVKDPTEVVKVGQRVIVRVLEVDQSRNRISLSLRGL